MISYLKGTVAQIQRTNNRVVLVLDVNQVGYEIQISTRMEALLAKNGDIIQVFTHQQIREDQVSLYGFSSAAERDLFRQLISVTGIGARNAIALLDTLGLTDLVQAIVSGNIRALAKTPGIGNKTAERIALELKTKLSQWRTEAGLETVVPAGNPSATVLEEVELTLLALGYTPNEIVGAMAVISQDSLLVKNPNPEDWIRAAISHLSL